MKQYDTETNKKRNVKKKEKCPLLLRKFEKKCQHTSSLFAQLNTHSPICILAPRAHRHLRK